MAAVRGSAVVLQRSEYERIKALAAKDAFPKRIPAEERRKALHMKSTKETSEWADTIAVERAKRLEAREKRLAQKELEQQELDRQEEQIQAEQRQAMIAKAKALLYQNNDGVKALQQADFLAEVLRERDAQGDFKGHRARLLAEQDVAREAARMEAAAREIQAEVEKQSEMRREATVTAGNQLEQAAMKRALRKAQRQAELAEQSARDEDAARYAEEQQLAAQKARETTMRFVKERNAQIDASEKRKEEYRKLIALEDERNRNHAAKREQQTEEFKKKMLEVRKAKIDARSRLANSLKVKADNRDAEENALIQKVMEQKWRAEDEAEVAKSLAREKRQKECNDFMKSTVAERAAAKEAAKKAAVAERIAIDEAAKREFEEELAKQARTFSTKVSVRDDHLAVAEGKRNAALAEKAAMAEARLKAEEERQAEEAALIAYAEARRAAAIARGVSNTYPLDKAVAAMKPKAPKPQPNLPSITTRRRGNPYPGDTKSRMGFIY